MHVTYYPEDIEFWISYYKSTIAGHPQYQLGGDLRGFRAYAPYHRGAGLGSFFKGLFRLALPLLKSAGKHAAVAGSKIVSDVAQGRTFKESAKEHGKSIASNLLRDTADRIEQSGRGLGLRHRPGKSVTVKRKSYKKKRSFGRIKKQRTVGSDIFGD